MKTIAIRILLVVAMVVTSLQANAQVKAFEKYADMKNVSYVYISKYMLSMAGKNAAPSVPNVNMKSLTSKLTGIQLINSDEKAARTKLKNDVSSIIARDKYTLLMQVKEDGDKVDIYYHADKRNSAVVMLVEEDDEVNVIVFSGTFTLDDVMKMTK